ncbi:hypothetical protein [Streptomyces sp. NPDC048845]|uniref:hypothetical protein n=1 Tax=Streptomyces sp. NPDC048845 TaxID=3155390 RepID=UPI00342E2CF5
MTGPAAGSTGAVLSVGPYRSDGSAPAGSGPGALPDTGNGRIDTDGGPAPYRDRAARRRRARFHFWAGVLASALLSSLCTVLALHAVPELPQAARAPAPEPSAGTSTPAGLPPARTLPVTVHNAQRDCRPAGPGGRDRPDCSLGLARDPYLPYDGGNVAARVRHGDELRAVCRVADGVEVTDEDGRHSRAWFRIASARGAVWLPAVRVRPGQPSSGDVPLCGQPR